MKVTILAITLAFLLVVTGCQSPDINENSGSKNIKDSISVNKKVDEITEENLINLLRIKRSKIIEILGKYEEGTMAVEESHMVFPVLIFDNGLTIYFINDEDLEPKQIDCNEKITIRNVHTGMNFSQVQDHLGRTGIIETWITNEQAKAYKIQYNFDKFTMEFVSYDKDGESSRMIISQ